MNTAQMRLEWIDALEPRAVVAGHNIAETRQYLRDFIRLDQTTDSPRALFDATIALYSIASTLGHSGSANAAKSETGNGAPITEAA